MTPVVLQEQSAPVLSAEERSVFAQEALDLFKGKRWGHLIHRMYMTRAALACWGEFMKHKSYYVTRSEIKIIRDYARVIGDMASHPGGIIGIENGPGTNTAMKAKSIPFFSSMPGLRAYMGRDWSPAIVDNVENVMAKGLPAIPVHSDLANFVKDPLPDTLPKGRKVMAEFGITRGNMEGFPWEPFPDDVFQSDLKLYRQHLNEDDFYVVTFDANEDERSVTQAYSSDWLTLWGRELFRSMQRELSIEGDFDPDSFFFRPSWHGYAHVNTNTMVAMRSMHFSVEGTPVTIYRDDIFGITNSYKIPAKFFTQMAGNSGFETAGLFQDRHKRMTMAVLRAK